MDGISKKIYLELQAPTEDDNRSDQRRIQDGLKEQGIEAKVSLRVRRGMAWIWKREIPLGYITVWRWIWEAPPWLPVWWTARQERS